MLERSAKNDLFMQFRPIYDQAGRFVDHLLVDANGRFDYYFDVPKEKWLGMRMSEIAETFEDTPFPFYELHQMMIPNTVKKFVKKIPQKEATFLITVMAEDPSATYLLFSEITGITAAAAVLGGDKALHWSDETRPDLPKLENSLFVDFLTQLYNRQYFEEELLRMDVARQLPLSIIVADVNGLKLINDAFGHKMGDQILSEVARVMREALRSEDVLARMGGDEFAVLLPRTDRATAEKIVERMRQVSQERSNGCLAISVSFGVAEKRSVEEHLSDVYQRADERMYQKKLTESRLMRDRIMEQILRWLEENQVETREHFDRLKKLSEAFGRFLLLDEEEIRTLKILSQFHDIGKVFVPVALLKKGGKPTEEEWETLRHHVESGFRLASSFHGIHHIDELVLDHHERWDGQGYPLGLRGKEIPLLDRIFAILDAFETMGHDQPYQNAKNREDIREELKKQSGHQFDPHLTQRFLEYEKTLS